MFFFQYIYNTIKDFFVFLSCRTNPNYTSLNDNEGSEQIQKSYNNIFEI